MPLSTVETKRGESGLSVRVSYQFKICPSYFSSFSSVETVSETRIRSSSASINPSFSAPRQDSRYIPIFVGEVRSATAESGSTRRLSGGRKFVSAVTVSRKKVHIFSASARSSSVFSTGGIFRSADATRASGIPSSHKTPRGRDAREKNKNTPTYCARISRKYLPFPMSSASTADEVFHSSSFLRVTSRVSARTAASAFVSVSNGSHASEKRHCKKFDVAAQSLPEA